MVFLACANNLIWKHSILKKAKGRKSASHIVLLNEPMQMSTWVQLKVSTCNSIRAHFHRTWSLTPLNRFRKWLKESTLSRCFKIVFLLKNEIDYELEISVVHRHWELVLFKSSWELLWKCQEAEILLNTLLHYSLHTITG